MIDMVFGSSVRYTFGFLLFSLIQVDAALAQTANTLSLPNAVFVVQAEDNSLLNSKRYEGSSPTSLSFSSSVGQASATVLGPVPSLATIATANDYGSLGQVRADESETFYFEVIGPQDINNVPVLGSLASNSSVSFMQNFTGTLAQTIGYISSPASSSFNFNLAQTCVSAIPAPSYDACSYPSSNYNFGLNLASNTIYSADIGATSFAVNGDTPKYMSSTANGDTASASISLNIYLDTSFLAENPDYSLIFSPGVGNIQPSAVPEPTSITCFMMGLFGIGLLRSNKLVNRIRRSVTSL